MVSTRFPPKEHEKTHFDSSSKIETVFLFFPVIAKYKDHIETRYWETVTVRKVLRGNQVDEYEGDSWYIKEFLD